MPNGRYAAKYPSRHLGGQQRIDRQKEIDKLYSSLGAEYEFLYDQPYEDKEHCPRGSSIHRGGPQSRTGCWGWMRIDELIDALHQTKMRAKAIRGSAVVSCRSSSKT